MISIICIYIYIYILIYLYTHIEYIIEGSLHSKLPTILRVEKQMKSR